MSYLYSAFYYKDQHCFRLKYHKKILHELNLVSVNRSLKLSLTWAPYEDFLKAGVWGHWASHCQKKKKKKRKEKGVPVKGILKSRANGIKRDFTISLGSSSVEKMSSPHNHGELLRLCPRGCCGSFCPRTIAERPLPLSEEFLSGG